MDACVVECSRSLIPAACSTAPPWCSPNGRTDNIVQVVDFVTAGREETRSSLFSSTNAVLD